MPSSAAFKCCAFSGYFRMSEAKNSYSGVEGGAENAGVENAGVENAGVDSRGIATDELSR